MRRCRRAAPWSTTCATRSPAGEFELHYQPVVNLASNEISGVEALHPLAPSREGHHPAQRLHPVAEEIGFIVPIGEWAIREACATAAKWPDDIKIAVNLSPVQFRNPASCRWW